MFWPPSKSKLKQVSFLYFFDDPCTCFFKRCSTCMYSLFKCIFLFVSVAWTTSLFWDKVRYQNHFIYVLQLHDINDAIHREISQIYKQFCVVSQCTRLKWNDKNWHNFENRSRYRYTIFRFLATSLSTLFYLTYEGR